MGGATPENFVEELKKAAFRRFKKEKTYFYNNTDKTPCENLNEDKEILKSFLEETFQNFIEMFRQHYKTRNNPQKKEYKLLFDSYGAVDDNLTRNDFPDIQNIAFSEEELDKFLKQFCDERKCTWQDGNKWRSYDNGKLTSLESDTKPDNLVECPKCVKPYYSESKQKSYFVFFPEYETKKWKNDENRRDCVA